MRGQGAGRCFDMLITYNELTLTLRAVDALLLPYYKGSTFRGGFGNVFRRVVCALKRQDCTDCILKQKCIYAYVFETSPEQDAEIMHTDKYSKVPHPFIIEPPDETRETFEPGEIILFKLILVGKAAEYLPYFIYTFDELGKTGIGRGRGKYSLLSVHNESGTIYSSGDKIIKNVTAGTINVNEEFEFACAGESSIKLVLLTPTRISYRRVLTSELPFHILIRNLLRRIALLYYFHCEKRVPEYDPKRIIVEAENVAVIQSSIGWNDWERYSSRQGTKMKMGGMTGEITYKGNIGPFLGLLKAGEILHVGKGTSFGLGKYSIQDNAKTFRNLSD